MYSVLYTLSDIHVLLGELSTSSRSVFQISGLLLISAKLMTSPYQLEFVFANLFVRVLSVSSITC